MNFGDLDLRSVHHDRPQVQTNTSQHSVTPTQLYFHDDDASSTITPNISTPETAIRWMTPPSHPAQRLLTPPMTPRAPAPQNSDPAGFNEVSRASTASQVVRFNEEQIRSVKAQGSERSKMKEEIDSSGPPTPNNDDTPYIRFAIEQLTRDEDIRAIERPPTGSSADTYPVARIISDQGLGYVQPKRSEDLRKELAAARKERALSLDEGGLFKFNPTRPLSSRSDAAAAVSTEALKRLTSGDSEFLIPVSPPVDTPRYPDLTFVPMILRPLSMITLSFLCLLMIIAIIVSAVYSSQHEGLVRYTDIYSGSYFLFGFIPQIFAAVIFLYIQSVMDAITRIMPYVFMAMEDPDDRADALFLDIYPKSLLLPRWGGYSKIDICNLCFWLAVFTIPLQSGLFAVLPTGGGWRWTTVQGVAWTLVGFYVIIMAAAIFICVFFFQRTTGLMWDPRSLADIIALLPRSNCLRDFSRTEIMHNKQEIRDRLGLRSDRLGYWRIPRTQAMFHCIGEIGASTRRYKLSDGKIHEKPYGVYNSADIESVADLYSTKTRFRHVPWYLRDTFVILWAVAASVILLALIIVSFLPSTALRKGFPPQVSALTNSAGFSPANFLYSFIPSLLGIILYLLFRPLDMAFRKLQPWAELAHQEGATAERSLLLDYPARLPISCTLSAFGAGHYRVGILSLCSFLFILLPVLSGGLFFALTTPSGYVRMIPNLPSFYILLILLILYVLALLLLIPKRHEMHLPHDVDCLAEIISFVHASRIVDDAPFRAPKTKANLVTRLMATQREGGEARFAFGVYMGRYGKECLGIERVGRAGAQEVMVLTGR